MFASLSTLLPQRPQEGAWALWSGDYSRRDASLLEPTGLGNVNQQEDVYTRNTSEGHRTHLEHTWIRHTCKATWRVKHMRNT